MRRPLTALTLGTALVFSPMAIANAAPEPTTGVETLVDENQWVAVPAEFNYAEALKGYHAQRKLRAEMWDLNVPFQTDSAPHARTIREAAAAANMPTKEAYVNGFRLDYGLSRIAVQRAAESVAGNIMHRRPTGTHCAFVNNNSCLAEESTATINGEGGWGMNLGLSQGRQNESIVDSVLGGWGHGELQALKNSRGKWTGESGHLYQALNPENTYHGFGLVRIHSHGKTYYSAATTFGHRPTTNGHKPLPDGLVSTNLYRAAVQGERPTGRIAFNNPWADGDNGDFSQLTPGAGNTGGTGSSNEPGDTSNKSAQRLLGFIVLLLTIGSFIIPLIPHLRNMLRLPR